MRILLIEDDVNLSQLLTAQLTQSDFIVDSCLNGKDALFNVSQTAYDVILLDRILPDMDGVAILNFIRTSGISTPVIFMTALGELQQKIEGFDAGADDYITKPFHIEELIARIKAILRRPDRLQPESSLRYGDLALDLSRHTLECNNKSVNMTKTEYYLMELFLKKPAKVFSREQLLSCVWGPGAEVESNNVDNYIYFLRRHLKRLKSSISIQTVYGIGYMLVSSENTNA